MAARPGPQRLDWNDVDRSLRLAANPFAERRFFQYTSDPETNTLSSVGMIAPTTEGVLTAANIPPMAAVNFTSTASVSGVSEGYGGWITAAIVELGWFPDIVFDWQTNAVTSERLWFGLFDADPKAIASPTGIRCVGFQWDAALYSGTGTFQVVSSNVSATPLVQDTGVTYGTIAVATRYRLRMRCRPEDAGWDFYINAAPVASIAASETTLPTSNVPLMIASKVTALSSFSGTRILRFGRMAGSMT